VLRRIARLGAYLAKLWWRPSHRFGREGTATIQQALHTATALPKRWPCHRTPKCFSRNGRRVRRRRALVMKEPQRHDRQPRRIVCTTRGIFSEALECGGDRATALGGRGPRRSSKPYTLRPPSQSGGLATALQSASRVFFPTFHFAMLRRVASSSTGMPRW